jgi:hypothetical protein
MLYERARCVRLGVDQPCNTRISCARTRMCARSPARRQTKHSRAEQRERQSADGKGMEGKGARESANEKKEGERRKEKERKGGTEREDGGGRDRERRQRRMSAHSEVGWEGESDQSPPTSFALRPGGPRRTGRSRRPNRPRGACRQAAVSEFRQRRRRRKPTVAGDGSGRRRRFDASGVSLIISQHRMAGRASCLGLYCVHVSKCICHLHSSARKGAPLVHVKRA